MAGQLTVRLPDDLNRALRIASKRMQRKTSDIVRLALREYLGAPGGTRIRPIDRVQGLIGSLESRVPDLAEKHRAYILDSLKPKRGR
jgi:hypothetical protein